MALPELGVGIVYFPALEPLLGAGESAVDFIEVEPQHFWLCDTHPGARPRLDARAFDRLAAYPRPRLVHGVGLALAGTVGLDESQLAPFRESVARLDPPWVSEHLAFLRAGSGQQCFDAGFFLPPLQSPEAVAASVRNIRQLQAAAGRPVAFENATNYLKPLPGEMPDGAFLAAVAEQADCGMLLDLHNLWCNQVNGRQSIDEVLSALPLERVWEVHLAGGDLMDGYWLDAHSGLVPAALMEVCRRWFPRLPNLKAVTFEIMPDYLPAKAIDADALLGQLRAIRELWALRGTDRRPPRCPPPEPSHRHEGMALPALAEWEQALARAVNRRPAGDAMPAASANDPAIGVLQQLVDNARAGKLVDLLTLSYRLMVLHLGEPRVRGLMEAYWRQAWTEPFAGREAAGFARFIEARRLQVPHLHEVLAYELASMDAVGSGRAQQVTFTCDPREVIKALREGRRPEAVTEGSYELTVTP